VSAPWGTREAEPAPAPGAPTGSAAGAMVTPAPVREARRAFPVPGPRVALEAAGVALLALIYAALLYHAWDVHWNIPIYENGSDSRQVGAWIKGIGENRWWVHNPRLGAPFAQDYHDFPANGETTQIVALKLLAFALPNYGWVMNVYYMAGFGLLAGVAFLVLRHLRFGVLVAAVIALAYTFLPFHVFHEQSHLTRSAYVTAPLAVLLLLWVFAWRSWFLRDTDPPAGTGWRANLASARVAAAVGLAGFIAASETMTTAFTMCLLAAVGIVTAVRWREPARLLISGGIIAVMLAIFLFVSIPTLHYWQVHGKNPAAGVRAPSESELFSLKLSRILLPPGDHRASALGKIGQKLQTGSVIPSEGGQYIGLLGIVGLVGGVIGLLGHGLRGPPRRDVRAHHERELLQDGAALIALVAVLFGTVSGLGMLIAATGFSMVRTWNRIDVLLAFAALIVTAIWLERGTRELRRRVPHPAAAVAVAAVLVGAFALWDDTPPAARDYRTMAASWNSDQDFVESIERRMPSGTMIFQFPPQTFPEAGPVGRMLDYDLFRGYLHDDGSLRWSYGAVKGRPRADWQASVRNTYGPIGALPGLLGLGFRGYWIDTYGYEPTVLAKLRRQLGRTLKTKPIVSRDGRLLFYDLRPFRGRLPQTDAELRETARRDFNI
jgi:hypothetical protein